MEKTEMSKDFFFVTIPYKLVRK